MEKKRVLWIDLLNICACICVLLLHTNFQYLQYDGSVSLPWLYGCIIFTVAYWAVPVFIMLSTCNLLNYQGGGKAILCQAIRANWDSVSLLEYSICCTLLCTERSIYLAGRN